MKLQVFESVDASDWDATVRAVGGTIFHSSTWAAYTAVSRPGIVPQFTTMLSDTGHVFGAALGFREYSRYILFSRIAQRLWLDAQPVVCRDDEHLLGEYLKLLEAYARGSGDVELCVGSFASRDGAQQLERQGFHVTKRFEFELNLQGSEDDLWRGFEYKRRKNINKAQRLGVKVVELHGPVGVAMLRRLQRDSGKRIVERGGPEVSYAGETSEDPANLLVDSGTGRIMGAEVDGEVVSAGLFTFFNGLVYHTLSGHSEKALETQAPTLLLWETIKRYRSEGARTFNFGGCSIDAMNEHSPEYGVYVYKRAFGAMSTECASGQKIVRKMAYSIATGLKSAYRLVSVRSHQSKTSHLFGKVLSGFQYFYRVPWCVPAWGWREFACTVQCFLTKRIAEGQYPAQFAEVVKGHLGMSYALPVNRGRTALELALRALQVEDTDVVLPSYICPSVLEAVVRAKARPIFADVGDDLNVTAETVKAALTLSTRCVVVAHLFGKTCPIDEIETMLRGTGIALIDDAAQSFGARCAGRLVGTFGACGIISCGPGKTLAGPAGGLLVTNDRQLYERAVSVRLDREHASTVLRRVLSFWLWRRFRRYTLLVQMLLERVLGPEKEFPHTTSTMSNLDGAIALQQFHAKDQNIRSRRRNAQALLQLLGPLASYSIADLSESSTILKLVLVLPPDGPSGEKTINLLGTAGIECQGGYAPLHLKMTEKSIPLPVTESVWNRVVCVPVDTEIKSTKRFLLQAGEWRSLQRSTRDTLQPSGSGVPSIGPVAFMKLKENSIIR